jgi:hypothetical protein
MQRVAMVLGLFLALCATIYLLGAPEDGEGKQPDPTMQKLKSSVTAANSAERALDDNNYGEAQAHIAALQKDLSELVFLLAENK